MGPISAAMNALDGTMASQWREYFYMDALPDTVLVSKAQKKTKTRFGGSRVENDNVISQGAVIAVADGQYMLIVDQGKIVDFCAEPGEYVFDLNTEPGLFYGEFSGEKVKEILKTTFDRLSFGGQAGTDQRVDYFNAKELIGNKYGTPSPVPFRVVDQNIGLDVDISVRCFGKYSYRVTNPMLFYANVCGNVEGEYTRDQIDSQLRSELLTALQPAFAKISEMGIRCSALPGHTQELAEALNDVLSEKWTNLRAIEIVAFGVSSVKASEEDEAMIKEAAEKRRAAQSQYGGCASGGRAGTGHAGRSQERRRRVYGLHGHECGTGYGRHERTESVPDGNAAATGGSRSTSCACGATAVGKFCPECGDIFDEGDQQ